MERFNDVNEANNFMNTVYLSVKKLVLNYMEMKGISSMIKNDNRQELMEYVKNNFDKIANIPEVQKVLSGNNLKKDK